MHMYSNVKSVIKKLLDIEIVNLLDIIMNIVVVFVAEYLRRVILKFRKVYML